MRKLFKIALIAAGLLIGLAVLLTIALRVMYPPAKLRHLVEEQIRINLHREARLGGARLGLRGLTLERFELSDVSTFAAGTFLTVDKLSVHWALHPLLSKQLRVTQIVLDKPNVRLVRM